MKISIVTPSFNQGRFLKQCIYSCLEQRHNGVELIVIDGGSDDESVAILESERRIAYWQSTPDGGQTAALNAGIRRVTGAITGWINSDDYYLPGAFEAVVRRFRQPDQPDVVFGYSLDVNADGRILRENRHDEFDRKALLSGGMDIRQQAMFWRSDLNSQLFPLDEDLKFCMDLQLALRMAERGLRIVRIAEYLGAFRIHGDAKSTVIPEVRVREHQLLVDKATEALGIRPPSRTYVLVRRRLNFLARGDWKYAILGGTKLIPRRARAAAEAAAIWCDQAAGLRR